MSDSINEILGRKFHQAEETVSEWQKIRDVMYKAVDGVTPDVLKNFRKNSDRLEKAIGQIIHDVSNPSLTLATTGTTSGGKSTLVNLLCGAEIMPVGAQEMSAGIVVIEHHPTKRKLKIPAIPGLSAALAGEWSDIPDDNISALLRQAMDGYRQLRESNPTPSTLRIQVQYPTRFGMSSVFAGLPPGFQLRIIDLPGYKQLSDLHNIDIIRNEIEQALCLVTYNSEDPDSDKQIMLLGEIVQKIKRMGGSPARMMFILNRIDAFRRDTDWEQQTNSFIEDTRGAIKTIVARVFPEYKEEHDNLNVHQLSTYPALCACKALNSTPEISIDMLNRIYRNFNFFLDGNIVEELSRNVHKWTDVQRKQVAEAVWQSSFGHSFDSVLTRHIRQNIFQLLPFRLMEAACEAEEALIAAHEALKPHLNMVTARYQHVYSRIEQIDQELYKFRVRSKQQLLKFIAPPDKYPCAVKSDLQNYYKSETMQSSPDTFLATCDDGCVKSRTKIIETEYRKRAFTVSGVTFRMVLISSGSFMMGSPFDEPGRDEDEVHHRVYISKSFWIAETHVTQELWMAVMGANPSFFGKRGWHKPVEQVSWEDCQKFIKQLNLQIPGGDFRLPIEAEWEYAARSGTTTPFNVGVCLDTNEANYNGNRPLNNCSRGERRGKTIDVASFNPNAWGLYDMHGNIWEWCEDWYGDYPPITVTDPTGPSNGVNRVVRGGGWDDYARNCRSAERSGDAPDEYFNDLGFRLVRTG